MMYLQGLKIALKFLKENRMITFTEIISCNGTALYETIPKQNRMNFVTSGKLSVLMAYDGMILLQLNSFQYGVNADQQIQYDDKDPQFSYIFYFKKYPQGQWILKVNQNSDQIFSCLNQKCYLKNRRQSSGSRSISQQKCTQKVNKKQKVKLDEKLVEKNQTQDDEEVFQQQTKDKSILIQASKGLGKGLMYGGKMISKGLFGLGVYLSKKVEPATEKIQVSQSTKNNINLAKKTTKNILNFTAEQVGALFKFGKSVAKDAAEEFQKSQKGKQLQQNKYYETVKGGVKTGATVFANIYEGVVNTVYEVGSGFSKGATKVVGAKYGKDAQQAADGMFEGVGNVAKIVRVPKDEAAKAFKE